MTVQTCFLCSVELAGETSSREHIIPNGIGGQLKSCGLLCEKCNKDCGGTIDAALVNQLLPMTNALNVVRERDDTPKVRVTLESGERLWRDADGNMRHVGAPPTVIERDGKMSISFTASSKAEVRKHLRGLKRKHPKLDVEATMANVQMRVTRVNKRMTFAFPELGGADAFRAIIKIAVSYYLHVGGRADLIREAIDAVAQAGFPPLTRVGWLYAIDPRPDRNDDAVLHALAIASDEHGGLHAYVELFSAFRFTVRLADAYAGPPIRAAYAYDVCTRKEVEIDATKLRGLPWTPENSDRRAVDKAMEPVVAVAVARNQAAWSCT